MARKKRPKPPSQAHGFRGIMTFVFTLANRGAPAQEAGALKGRMEPVVLSAAKHIDRFMDWVLHGYNFWIVIVCFLAFGWLVMRYR